MSGTPVRVLILEDNPDDAELAVRELTKAGLHPEWERVETENAFVAALARPLDLILADYNLPDFDGISALERVGGLGLEVPFIIVSGSIGEEAAVAAMQRGAADYVLKDRLARLGPAATKAIARFGDRRDRVEAEAKLRRLEKQEAKRRIELAERGRRQAEARFEHILELAPDGILTVDEEGDVRLFNRGAEAMFGCPAHEIAGMPVTELFPDGLPAPAAGPAVVRARRRDGAEFPAELSTSSQPAAGGLATTVICRDVTERQRADDDLRALYRLLDERLRAGVDLVADLAATLNPHEVVDRMLRRLVEAVAADAGILLDVGEGGELTVRDSHDVEGESPLPPGGGVGAPAVVADAVASGLPRRGEGIESAAGGEAGAWLAALRRTAAIPLRAAGTNAVILVGRRRDEAFTDRELETLEVIGGVAALTLRNARLYTAAEAASVAKSEFLNMAAHELRTPVTVISGYLSLLTDGSLGGPGAAWLEPIQTAHAKAGELTSLVDALLLTARLEASTVETRVRLVDLVPLAADAARRAEARAIPLGGTVLLEAPPGRVPVEADPMHVGRILDSLLDNALTYVDGPPWVKVTVRADATVEVEDRGPGVPDDRREAIFERFHRVADPNLPSHPGTGLGLYIARELAGRLGGTVSLEESRLGEGSRFVLRLRPAAEGPRQAAVRRLAEVKAEGAS